MSLASYIVWVSLASVKNPLLHISFPDCTKPALKNVSAILLQAYKTYAISHSKRWLGKSVCKIFKAILICELSLTLEIVFVSNA